MLRKLWTSNRKPAGTSRWSRLSEGQIRQPRGGNEPHHTSGERTNVPPHNIRPAEEMLRKLCHNTRHAEEMLRKLKGTHNIRPAEEMLRKLL